jgi:regulator of protease activity HflC (stomatin/prohibitin superfamily)
MNELETRITERLGWLGVASAAVLTAAGAYLAYSCRCLALVPAALGAGVLLLLALVLTFRLHLQRRQEVEEENLELFRRERADSELFEDSDEALKIAARTNRIYAAYAVPILSGLIGVLAIAGAVIAWHQFNALPSLPSVEEPLKGCVLSLSLFLAGLIAGSYYVGVSRASGGRWLRPYGAWLFFTGGLFLLAGLALLAVHLRPSIVGLDLTFAKIGLAAVLVLGVELAINVIIDFYRPRVAREEKPVLESRILALFTEPGGLARNVAASLDYQFGFKVSEAWFYRFLERAVIPFAIVLVIFFWLLTCLVVINAEENGIRERFGRVVSETPLMPGLYTKLPWPFARIYKFPVARVQQIPIGYIPGGEGAADDQMPPEMPEDQVGDLTGRVIVWDKSHNKDEMDFVVASKPETTGAAAGVGADAGSKVPVSIYFMSASIPLYFRVENLYDYAYLHQDPRKTLERIAMREVVRYLASVDLFDVLSAKRAEGGTILAERIQAASDRVQLGIEVVFVGLQGIHPPVRVGQFFNEVVSASEEKHTAVLQAEKYAIGQEPDAEAKAIKIKAVAEGYRYDRVQVARAEAERFHKQLRGYAASPRIFVLRSFLDLLETEAQAVRKYIIATESGREVVILNLEEKLRPDLLDIDLGDEDQTE